MKKLERYCQALDLHDDPQLIAEYEEFHQKIWPEIAEHLKDIGIENMEIWRIGTRLFMIMEVNESYDVEIAAEASKNNKVNQEWEMLMWKYQVATPWAKDDEKWVAMTKIFDLSTQ